MTIFVTDPISFIVSTTMGRSMDLNKLKIFYYAAKGESFTNCELNLTPSVISRHISDLEFRHKVKLFHRSPRRLVLTEQGEILFKAAERIMAESERVQVALQESGEELQGPIRVITPMSWTSSVLARHIGAFMKKHPKVTISIINDDRFPELMLRENDVALLPYAPEHPHLISEKIAQLNLGLFAGKEYLEQYGEPQSAEELDQHRLVAYSEHDRHMDHINWHLTVGCKPGEMRTPCLRVNNLYLAVEENLGIVSLAKENPLLKSGDVKEVLSHIQGPRLKGFLVYSQTIQTSRRIQSFRDFFRDIAKKEGLSIEAESRAA